MQFDKEFDASGLACPMPIVKTKKSLDRHGPRPGAARGRHRPGLGLRHGRPSPSRPATRCCRPTTENSKYVFFLRKA